MHTKMMALLGLTLIALTFFTEAMKREPENEGDASAPDDAEVRQPVHGEKDAIDRAELDRIMFGEGASAAADAEFSRNLLSKYTIGGVNQQGEPVTPHFGSKPWAFKEGHRNDPIYQQLEAARQGLSTSKVEVPAHLPRPPPSRPGKPVAHKKVSEAKPSRKENAVDAAAGTNEEKLEKSGFGAKQVVAQKAGKKGQGGESELEDHPSHNRGDIDVDE